MKMGYWKLEVTGIADLTDIDKEHIAEMIVDGFTEGDIVQYDNEDVEQEEVRDPCMEEIGESINEIRQEEE